MPNHVYTIININDDLSVRQKDRLKDFRKNKGICKTYLPMPKELSIDHDLPKDLITELRIQNEEKYGSEDWYDWCNKNWGTKWGDYDLEVNDYLITYASAWSPLGDNIIEKLLKDFPNITYEWEEEQGYGAVIKYQNGKQVDIETWDIPIIRVWDVPGIIVHSEVPHKGMKDGFYNSYPIDEETYLGKDIIEVFKTTGTIVPQNMNAIINPVEDKFTVEYLGDMLDWDETWGIEKYDTMEEAEARVKQFNEFKASSYETTE